METISISNAIVLSTFIRDPVIAWYDEFQDYVCFWHGYLMPRRLGIAYTLYAFNLRIPDSAFLDKQCKQLYNIDALGPFKNIMSTGFVDNLGLFREIQLFLSGQDLPNTLVKFDLDKSYTIVSVDSAQCAQHITSSLNRT